MSVKTGTLLAIIGLGLLDAIILGLPILALILIYVVVSKPPWFSTLVQEIYRA